MDHQSDLFIFLAGLTLLVFSMKVLSNSLEQIGREFLSMTISKGRRGRIKSFSQGLLSSMALWSSTTVSNTVTGMTNAGHLRLSEAMAIVIGSTVGASFISVFVSLLSVKVMALCFAMALIPYVFAGRTSWRYFGGALLGIGLLIFSLDYLSIGFKYLITIQKLSFDTFLISETVGLVLGFILTFSLSSSLMALCIVFAMISVGYTNFEFCYFFVLGVNLGRAYPMISFSKDGNKRALRLARGSFLTTVSSSIFFATAYFLGFDLEFYRFVVGSGKFNDGFLIATFHFLFNVSTAFWVLILLNPIVKFLGNWIKQDYHGDPTELKVFGDGKNVTPTMGLIQVRNQLKDFQSLIKQMFELTDNFLSSVTPSPRDLGKIKELEHRTDLLNAEISLFLEKLTRQELTSMQSNEVYKLFKAVRELERIGDYIDKLATGYAKIIDHRIRRTDKDNLLSLLNEVRTFFNSTLNRAQSIPTGNIDDVHNDSQKIKKMAEEMVIHYAGSQKVLMERGSFNPDVTLSYIEMINALKKIRSHTFLFGDSLITTKN